ncbi:hemolysin family protein [Dehalococcoidia bacterium]|nr:hemolysin family protein [Dehalococcoidia bacterium]
MESTVPIGEMNIVVQVLGLIFSIMVVAFFTSSEAALISVNKIRVRHLAEQGNRRAQAVGRVASKHEKFFATILLTENLFIISASSVGTALAISIMGEGGVAVVVATLIMTVIVVMFGEITPKSLAAQASERWSLFVGPIIETIMSLETSVIYFFTLPPRLIVWLIGGREVLQTPSVTEGELRMLVDIGRSEGMLEHAEAQLIENVFRFGDQQLREMMTPRTEIVSLEKGATIKTFLEIYSNHSHTRFPVCENMVDNILGTVSVKDVVRAIATGDMMPDDDATQLLRPAYFVPETKLIGQLFHELRGSGHQMVIVADEFGGVAGLVTMKQMVEQIVGHVTDEGMATEEEFHVINANTYQIDGGARVGEANERLELGIPDGFYETIAGFMLARLGHIPREGERIHHNGFLLEVKDMRGVRIDQVTVTRVAKPANSDNE